MVSDHTADKATDDCIEHPVEWIDYDVYCPDCGKTCEPQASINSRPGDNDEWWSDYQCTCGLWFEYSSELGYDIIE
jgi:lysyl-tRNA synthetase class I